VRKRGARGDVLQVQVIVVDSSLQVNVRFNMFIDGIILTIVSQGI